MNIMKVSNRKEKEIIEYFFSTGESLKVLAERFALSHIKISNVITDHFKKKSHDNKRTS